jgi:hypothetical protein
VLSVLSVKPQPLGHGSVRKIVGSGLGSGQRIQSLGIGRSALETLYGFKLKILGSEVFTQIRPGEVGDLETRP